MRLTAIDIGTNTILMLIADVHPNGTMGIVRDEHVIARLGKGVDERQSILPATFERVLSYLTEYKRISDEAKSQRIIACGTSAFRDASNRDEFIAFIKDRVGFDIRVLSGEEEAELTYAGAVSEFVRHGRERFGVLDIGGGSTELTFGKGMQVLAKQSLDMGAVRLTERYLRTSPPTARGLEEASGEIQNQLKKSSIPSSIDRFIGVAGTLTTLAALDLRLPSYDQTKVSGHILPLKRIVSIFDELRGKTLEELKRYPQILPDRADIILAGILILLEVMRKLNLAEITSSDRGLRYGILLEAAQKSR